MAIEALDKPIELLNETPYSTSPRGPNSKHAVTGLAPSAGQAVFVCGCGEETYRDSSEMLKFQTTSSKQCLNLCKP